MNLNGLPGLRPCLRAFYPETAYSRRDPRADPGQCGKEEKYRGYIQEPVYASKPGKPDPGPDNRSRTEKKTSSHG